MEYLRILRRRWPIVLGATLVALLATWLTLPDGRTRTTGQSGQVTLYEAQHTLKLEGADGEAQLGFQDLTVLASGDRVRERAVTRVRSQLESIGDADDVPVASVSPDEVQGLITYTVSDPGAELARVTADAYAAALKGYAAERVQDRRDEQISQLERRRDQLGDELLSAPNPSPGDTSAQADLARAQRQAIYNSFVSVIAELQSLKSTDAAADTGLFTLERAAATAADTDVVSLGPPVNGMARVGYGGALGLVLGLALALVVDHVDPRVHTSDGVSEAVGAPVLGTVQVAVLSRRLPTPWTRPDAVFRRIARLLPRLPRWLLSPGADAPIGRNEPERLPPTDVRSLLVASLGSARDSAEVAARLAAATADDDRVVGLVNRSPGREHLKVLAGSNGHGSLGSGATALPWSPDSARRPGIVLVERRWDDGDGRQDAARTDLDVLDVGRLDEAVDGLSLLSEVDGVILVVPLGHVAATSLADARATLANIDAPVIGLVLLDPSWVPRPRLRRHTQSGDDTDRADERGTGKRAGPEQLRRTAAE